MSRTREECDDTSPDDLDVYRGPSRLSAIKDFVEGQ